MLQITTGSLIDGMSPLYHNVPIAKIGSSYLIIEHGGLRGIDLQGKRASFDEEIAYKTFGVFAHMRIIEWLKKGNTPALVDRIWDSFGVISTNLKKTLCGMLKPLDKAEYFGNTLVAKPEPLLTVGITVIDIETYMYWTSYRQVLSLQVGTNLLQFDTNHQKKIREVPMSTVWKTTKTLFL